MEEKEACSSFFQVSGIPNEGYAPVSEKGFNVLPLPLTKEERRRRHVINMKKSRLHLKPIHGNFKKRKRASSTKVSKEK